MRRWPGVLLLMVVTPFLHACGGGAEVSGDCSVRLRHDGVVYSDAGRTGVGAAPHATRLGEAERARCDDVGREARGSYFEDDPDELDLVEVWSFEGYDAASVIGTPAVDGSYDLLFADGVTDSERQELESDLLSD